jgi:hypothetical protein
VSLRKIGFACPAHAAVFLLSKNAPCNKVALFEWFKFVYVSVLHIILSKIGGGSRIRTYNDRIRICSDAISLYP